MSNFTNVATDNPIAAKCVSPQFMSQDGYASSSLSSSTNITLNESLAANDSIDTNTDSYDNSSKVVEQSLPSLNVVVNRNRTRETLTQAPKNKENCIPFYVNNDDRHDQEDFIYFVDS